MSFLVAGEELLQAISAGLYEAGTLLLARSQPLVPVDTGTLKSSGTVTEPHVEGDALVVEVGYGYGDEVNPESGEPAAGYAVYVHERLDVHHDAPTQAKFLEQPARELEPEFTEIVAGAVRRRLGA